MSNTTTTTELTNMNVVDLQKEVRAQENAVVKLRLGVQMGSEKDSAKYARAKKQLARMKTVLSSKKSEPKNNEDNVSQSAKKSVSSLPTEAQKAKVGRIPKQS